MRFVALLLIALSPILAQDFTSAMERGAAALTEKHYPEAVTLFRRALQLNPKSASAHLGLGTAYQGLWFALPIGAAPNNADADRADAELAKVLEMEPDNAAAIGSLALFSYFRALSAPTAEKARYLDASARWYQRLILLGQNRANAFYMMGVIACARVEAPMMAARGQRASAAKAPGFIADPAVRAGLRTRFAAVIDDGIASLEQALALDPNLDAAVNEMSFLTRARADIQDRIEEMERASAIADDWDRKAADARKRNPNLLADFVKKAQTGTAPAPPPAAKTNTATIRVSAADQAANLIRRVEPFYPPLAKQSGIHGVVRFTAAIAKDGTVRNLQLISGHPLLVTSANVAVKQWVYRPTLLNGQPVDVIAEIEVHFTLP